MPLVPQVPLRVLLATLALVFGGVSLTQQSLPLTLSAGIGAAALLALAGWGPRFTLPRAHYLLALGLSLPWISQVPFAEPGSWPKLLLAVLALAFWASMGLRRPRDTRPGHQPWRIALTLLGLSLLWMAMGCMGGTLSSLVWSASPAGPAPSALDPLAPNLLFGVTLVVFRHGQFYLQAPKG